MRGMRLTYPLPLLSRMLGVSSSGYYGWVDRPLSQRAQEEIRLEVEIKAAHHRTRQTYGPERLQGDLAENGIQVVVGAEAAPAEDLVRQHLAGALKTGENVCDH